MNTTANRGDFLGKYTGESNSDGADPLEEKAVHGYARPQAFEG